MIKVDFEEKGFLFLLFLIVLLKLLAEKRDFLVNIILYSVTEC